MLYYWNTLTASIHQPSFWTLVFDAGVELQRINRPGMLHCLLESQNRKVGEMVFLCNIRRLAEGKGTNNTVNAINNCRPVNSEITEAAGENLLKKNYG